MEFVPICSKETSYDILQVKCKWTSSYEDEALDLLKPKTPAKTTDKFILLSWAEYDQLHQKMHSIADHDPQKMHGEEEEEGNEKADRNIQWIPQHLVRFLRKFRIDQTVTEASVSAILGQDLWDWLHPYQKEGLLYMIKRGGRCILGDEMGLGKTVQSLCLMYYYYLKDRCFPILIVCPSVALQTWTAEWANKLKADPSEIMIIKKSSDDCLKTACNDVTKKCYVVSIDLLRHGNTLEYLQKKKFKSIIVDESHSIRNKAAQKTVLVSKLIKNADHCVLSTGTSMAVSANMYSMIHACRPTLYPVFFNPSKSVFSYAWRYCQPVKKKFGPAKAKWEYKGAERCDELHGILRHVLLVRRKVDDVKSQNRLPPLIREYIPIKLSPEVLSTLDGRKIKDENMHVKNDTFMDLYQRTMDAKLPIITDHINNMITKGMFAEDPSLKWLIFGFSVEVLKDICGLMDEHKIKYIHVDGSTTHTKRFRQFQSFQESGPDSPRVAVLNWVAAGVAVSLTKATLVWFVQLPFDPLHNLQAEKRASRPGQTKPVLVQYFHAPGTIDDRLRQLLKKKDQNAARVLDGTKEGSFKISNKRKKEDKDNDDKPVKRYIKLGS